MTHLTSSPLICHYFPFSLFPNPQFRQSLIRLRFNLMVTTGTVLLTRRTHARAIFNRRGRDLHMLNASDLADPQQSATFGRGAWEAVNASRNAFHSLKAPQSLFFCQRLTFLDWTPNAAESGDAKVTQLSKARTTCSLPKFTQDKTHAEGERRELKKKKKNTPQTCHVTFFGLRVCDL